MHDFYYFAAYRHLSFRFLAGNYDKQEVKTSKCGILDLNNENIFVFLVKKYIIC